MNALPRSARALIALFALGWTLLLAAADRDYGLSPVRIADDTWALVGRSEDFSLSNGGNIVNTAFIVTSAGVVVIDSGPSRSYGEQLKRAIARITDKPVSLVLNTHHHPDHFLGNQAFAPETLAALPEAAPESGNPVAARVLSAPFVVPGLAGRARVVPTLRWADTGTACGARAARSDDVETQTRQQLVGAYKDGFRLVAEALEDVQRAVAVLHRTLVVAGAAPVLAPHLLQHAGHGVGHAVRGAQRLGTVEHGLAALVVAQQVQPGQARADAQRIAQPERIHH